VIIINQEIILGLIVAATSILTVVASKQFDKLTTRATTAAAREDREASGLRLDLARKDSEMANLRIELRDADNELDELRVKLLQLKERIYRLRLTTYSLLIAAGKTPEEIEEILPPLLDIFSENN